jgi:N-glycosylase/DNA lyase
MKSQIEMVNIDRFVVSSEYFDVAKTLECGQCFRWQKEADTFVGVVAQSLLVIEPYDDDNHMVSIYGKAMTYEEVAHYFDLKTEYKQIFDQLGVIDDHMRNAATYGKGIRILNQEPFETLMSFILSSNNNIPKIRMTVEALSEKFGTYLGHFQGKPYYTFPDIKALASESLESLNVKAIGYRAKSIYNTCNRIVEAGYNLQEPFIMDYESARTWLTQFYGVGGKVADCVLLFAYGKMEAFPIDTWVKKMLGQLYDVHTNYETFVKEKFIRYPGMAQQILFYYIRNLR